MGKTVMMKSKLIIFAYMESGLNFFFIRIFQALDLDQRFSPSLATFLLESSLVIVTQIPFLAYFYYQSCLCHFCFSGSHFMATGKIFSSRNLHLHQNTKILPRLLLCFLYRYWTHIRGRLQSGKPLSEIGVPVSEMIKQVLDDKLLISFSNLFRSCLAFHKAPPPKSSALGFIQYVSETPFP